MLHRGDANGLAVPRLALDGKRNAAAFGRALGLIAITFHCQRKHRLVYSGCSSQRSPTGHLNRGIDRVFEIVRVVSRGLVSIAEVHAIVAGAHHAQSEPEMARDRLGLLERHGFVKSSSGSVSKAVDELHAMLDARPSRVSALEPPATVEVSLAVEATCQLVALTFENGITLASPRGSPWPRHRAPCASGWHCVRPAHGFPPIRRGCRSARPWARTCSAGAQQSGSRRSASGRGSR